MFSQPKPEMENIGAADPVTAGRSQMTATDEEERCAKQPGWKRSIILNISIHIEM